MSGGHHAKFGYDGGYYTQLETNKVNDIAADLQLRLAAA